MPDLKIVVGADVSQAKQGADSLTTSLGKTAIAAQKIDSSLGKSVSSINKAGDALTNLGRVAQDAPFGFIGIQNNLNPLLESFQRLRSEAGSNVGALKALGSSLIGAGGLGLALSVVSSGILLYQKYFSDAKEVTKDVKEEVKATAGAYGEFLAQLEKVTAAAGQEAAKVSILFSALSDSNIGLRERKGIIEQLNQVSPGYLGQLDKEKAAYEDISKAVFAYTESLAKSSEIKALLPEVDKLFQGLINAQVQLNQLRRFQGGDKSDPGFFGLSAADFKAQESALQNSIKNFSNQIRQAKAGLENFAGGSLSLSEILFGKTPELSKGKVAKDIETVSDVLEKLGRQIRLLNQEQLDLGIDKSKEKISAVQSAINTLTEKFKIDPKSTIIQKLFGDIRDINIASFQEDLQSTINKVKLRTSADVLFDMEQMQKEIDATTGKKKLKTKVEIQFSIDNSDKKSDFQNAAEAEAKKREKALIDYKENLESITSNAFVDIFTSISESLGSGENLFSGFLKALGQGLKTLGAYMISMSTIIKGIKTAIKSLNPTLLLIGGVALVAIGTAISSARIPGFATGVTNFSGGVALVGERGPELVNLPRGSDVIPNHRLGGVGAAAPIIFIADQVTRGSDLVTVFRRAEATNRRNN